MAKVYFKPFHAIKYTGLKAKEFSGSLERPRPILKKGDIVIVDRKTAFNLTHNGFSSFVEVEYIELEELRDANVKIEELQK